MVVGIDDGIVTLVAAQQLNGPVRDDLIGIHIDGGTRTALNGIYNELLMELTGQDLVAGLYNGIRNVLVQEVYFTVDNGCGLFNISQAVDNFRMHVQPGNMEVFGSPEGLYAIINVLGNILCADGVLFYTKIIGHIFHNMSLLLFRLTRTAWVGLPLL